jgi:hypothetical protein
LPRQAFTSFNLNRKMCGDRASCCHSQKMMSNVKNSSHNLLNAGKSQQPQRLYKSLFASALMLGTGTFFIGISGQPVLADPVPNPPPPIIPSPLPPTILPSVFCFRFTDIKAVETDAEGDKFQVSFEVLNWSNQPASGVRIALNTGTNSFVQDVAPSFAGAEIDFNGSPLGNDADPLPGNQLFTNNGSVVESTETAIQWDAEQFNFNTFNSGPIPNQDLLGVPSPGGTGDACNIVSGCQIQGGQPVVADIETVDNGNNVLDGFVMTLDNLNEGEVISFNWNLLDVNGNPIGTPGNGNAYGFGSVNLARIASSDSGSDYRVFPENTGVGNSIQLFARGSDQVIKDGDEVALFAAEFGAGITAPFLNQEDNIFDSGINTQPIDYSSDPPTDPENVPEPSMVGASILAGVGLLRRRSRQKK